MWTAHDMQNMSIVENDGTLLDRPVWDKASVKRGEILITVREYFGANYVSKEIKSKRTYIVKSMITGKNFVAWDNEVRKL